MDKMQQGVIGYRPVGQTLAWDTGERWDWWVRTAVTLDMVNPFTKGNTSEVRFLGVPILVSRTGWERSPH